jgi:hypothetical protein
MFFVPQDASDRMKSPPPPDMTAKVDGKEARAVDVDGKPLQLAPPRLESRTG